MRPWQGTALGVVAIIGAVFTGIGFLLSLFAAEMFSAMMSISPEVMTEMEGMEGVEAADVLTANTEIGTAIFGAMGIFFAVIMLAILILHIFIARGAFKGQKWSPIVMIVFVVLGFLGLFSNVADMGIDTGLIIQLAINAFVLYCAIICVKAPFFGKKKA